jgi:multidrug resistance efflux pump
VVALVWGTTRGQQVEARGIGFAKAIDIASQEGGRLKSVSVELHQTVTANQMVAQLDIESLKIQHQVAVAELEAVRQNQANSALLDGRRFLKDVEANAFDRARQMAAVREDEALLASLKFRLTTEQSLLSAGAASAFSVQDLERDVDTVRARLEAGQLALAVASTSSVDAQARLSDAPLGNDHEVQVAQRRLDEISWRIDEAEMHSPFEGQVTWIYATPGEVLSAGAPVVRVDRMGTAEVHAFVHPSELHEFENGAAARVVRSSGEVIEGAVVSVGAAPRELPENLWMNPVAPEWAVPVRIQLIDGMVAPDEAVTVRI